MTVLGSNIIKNTFISWNTKITPHFYLPQRLVVSFSPYHCRHMNGSVLFSQKMRKSRGHKQLQYQYIGCWYKIRENNLQRITKTKKAVNLQICSGIQVCSQNRNLSRKKNDLRQVSFNQQCFVKRHLSRTYHFHHRVKCNLLYPK